jgi:hypothetical protein
MGILRAASHELHATANGSHTLADELTGATPSVPGLSFQPSAAAVAGALTARTLMTAAKTISAATAYTNNEATSAARLNALSGSM